MAATWVLDHLRGVVEEGPTDGGVMGVERAMDGSRGRCFLRARHELASVALQAVVGKIAGPSGSSAGLSLRGEGRQVGRVPAGKPQSIRGSAPGAVGASRWRRLVEFYRSTCIADRRVTATPTVYRDCVAMSPTHACSRPRPRPQHPALSPQHLTLCVHGRRMTPWLIEVPESERAAAAACETQNSVRRHCASTGLPTARGVHRRSCSCVTCSFTYLVLVAIHEDLALDFLFFHEARAETDRVGARRDLRMVFGSAVGRSTCERAVGNSNSKTRGGGCGMVVRRVGRMAGGDPWRRGHDSPSRLIAMCFVGRTMGFRRVGWLCALERRAHGVWSGCNLSEACRAGHLGREDLGIRFWAGETEETEVGRQVGDNGTAGWLQRR
jgi:hypothetical protein